MRSFFTKFKIAFTFLFLKDEVGYFMRRHTGHKNKKFPKYCKNIKWYPGLPDAIKINGVGEYFHCAESSYYVFKNNAGMVISAWEIAARKDQLDFWEVSNQAFLKKNVTKLQCYGTQFNKWLSQM